jgi:uncharacterized SAM-binding protein YcdF (DUF218 family)
MKSTMASEDINRLARKIWDYHHVKHTLEKADCIVVLGSHDVRVAEYGAKLFLEGWAPIIIFSGGVAHEDDLLKTSWDISEAEVFANRAKEMGVPEEKIIIENKATNCGENILFTKKILEEKNLNPEKIILVQKPYMERRSYATFKRYWPDKKVIVTSPPFDFDEYPTEEITIENIIHIMVGDLQRIKIYSEKGFQISQDIPDDVLSAYERLIKIGFTKHLIEED